MRRTFNSGLGLCLVCAWSCATAGAAPVVGYVMNFNGGNTDNWGNAVQSATLVGNGQGGVADQFMNTVAQGGGPGGALAINTFSSNWIGNYQAAQVLALGVDLLSPASNTTNPLQMRVVLFAPAGARYTSTVPFLLPNDGQWHHAVFPLGVADLTRVLGSDTYDATITGVTELMFRYAVSSTQSGGSGVVGTLGVDNIKALPEPSGGLLLGIAIAGLLRRRRR